MRLTILLLHTQQRLKRGEHSAHTTKCRHGKKHTDFSLAKHTLHSDTAAAAAATSGGALGFAGVGAFNSWGSRRGGGKSDFTILNR
nr:hypothetical protein 2 - Choristoneura fumiferana nuclear polyhedrosis virus [Choristoneura fumiferana multiple nucleopolyhedrovirus]